MPAPFSTDSGAGLHPGEAGDVAGSELVAASFARLLRERAFMFSPVGFMAVHRRLLAGVHPSAGRLREEDEPRSEWVIGGEKVYPAAAEELREALEYEFAQEKRFDFAPLSLEEVLEHVAGFLASLWQLYPFTCGNAHVLAVFAAQYLRSLGFEVEGGVFAGHVAYFHHALVRATYRHLRLRIMPDPAPLVQMLRSAALGEAHEFDPLSLRVGGAPRPVATEEAFTAPLPAPADASSLHLRHKRLLRTLGGQTLGVSELLRVLRLTTRQSFMRVWLTPAMELGLVKALHPESPRHPLQKYLLTRKGQRFLRQLVHPQKTS